MQRTRLGPRPIHAAYLIVALAAMGSSGCLVVAAGAAGAAVAGYAYFTAPVCRPYVANFGDTWAAVHTALAELGMPVVSERQQAAHGTIESRTADGDRVKIDLEPTMSRIPAEGAFTEVCVRVATFGDTLVSERIHSQIGAHLVSPPPPPSPPGATSATPAPPLAPGPRQPAPLAAPGLASAEPPLAK